MQQTLCFHQFVHLLCKRARCLHGDTLKTDLKVFTVSGVFQHMHLMCGKKDKRIKTCFQNPQLSVDMAFTSAM